ncbi:farnesyl-diphosphate synthase [Boletus edulis]|nr:farnesyl-diphosphate synthase [Boletus edulis]
MATDKQERRQKFEGVFAKLRDDLVDRLKGENMPPESVEWYRRNLDFNVPGGKLNRGMSVVDSVEILRGRGLTEDEYFQAALLGWCIELVGFMRVLVFVVKRSDFATRAGTSFEGVGLLAINDAFMLEGAIYLLLKTHFREEPYYVHLLELFHDTTFQTEMGQLVDLITAPEDRIDLSQFSLKKHAFIVQYKTAYYSFYLSVALAMRVCGVPESYEVHGQTVRPYEVALSILLPLGEYFQIQDDFLDYAGTPEQIGKIGTDIPEQRAVLDANYGRKDAAKEAKVKEVYEAIGLRERYRVYEEEVKTRLDGLIASVPEPEGMWMGVC